MADSILDLNSPWIPVKRKFGGQTWRLRFTHESLRLIVEHFGGEQASGQALAALLLPGPKKASTLVVYLWAGLQEDAYLKWKRGDREGDVVTLEEVKSWLPDDRGALIELLNDIFDAYKVAQPDPNS